MMRALPFSLLVMVLSFALVTTTLGFTGILLNHHSSTFMAARRGTARQAATKSHSRSSSSSSRRASFWSSLLASRDVPTNDGNEDPVRLSAMETMQRSASRCLASTALSCGLLFLPGLGGAPVAAYNPTDYTSDTVAAAIGSLKAAAGNVDKTFSAYEEIAAIITEGKGVGGDINYKGIQLDRGYVSDEDTAIYNPGLTLLTESEKERLVEAVVDSRTAALNEGQWNEDTQLGFDFLRMRLDPYHMYELKGYLRLVPVVVAVAYIGVTAVQQLVRDLFPVAYFVGLAAVVLPALILVLAGP